MGQLMSEKGLDNYPNHHLPTINTMNKIERGGRHALGKLSLSCNEAGKYAVVSSVLMAIIRQCGIYNNRIIYNKVVAKKAYGTGKLDNLLVTAKVLHTKK